MRVIIKFIGASLTCFIVEYNILFVYVKSTIFHYRYPPILAMNQLVYMKIIVTAFPTWNRTTVSYIIDYPGTAAILGTVTPRPF